jgi:hypothetical protein
MTRGTCIKSVYCALAAMVFVANLYLHVLSSNNFMVFFFALFEMKNPNSTAQQQQQKLCIENVHEKKLK